MLRKFEICGDIRSSQIWPTIILQKGAPRRIVINGMRDETFIPVWVEAVDNVCTTNSPYHYYVNGDRILRWWNDLAGSPYVQIVAFTDDFDALTFRTNKNDEYVLPVKFIVE